MITVKNHNQKELFDPWEFLGPKRRQRLDYSWPGLFKNVLLKELPVDELAALFRSDFGRPTKELYTVLGVLLLQEYFDLTDEEAVDQLAFNTQWHYALNITDESDSAKYIAAKTLWTMRSRAVEHKLDQRMFEQATQKLCTVFKVDCDKQRIDSVHIKSNMRRLGRIGIFVRSIHGFFVNLKRHHPQLFATIDTGIVERYCSKHALSCFSRVKPSESAKTLDAVSKDLFALVEQFKAVEAVVVMYSFKLLVRVLAEQCIVDESAEQRSVVVKASEQVPSDSLQNPSDPDASYNGHKGQGYQVQLMETYSDTEQKEAREKELKLITYVEVEPAHQSDARALLPAVASASQRSRAPQKLLADSLYGSDENWCTAHDEHGVELIAPVKGQRTEGRLTVTDFTTAADGSIVACPHGQRPQVLKRKRQRHVAGFACSDCESCPERQRCPVKTGKQHYYLHYTQREVRVGLRRAYEQSR